MFKKNRVFWITALVGLVVDRLSKFMILYAFSLPLPPASASQAELDRVSQTLLRVIPGVFHFTYALNKGAAFSVFPEGVTWLRWLSLGVSIALMAWAWSNAKWERWEQAGFGFILSGAAGNGIDRFVWGYVVDFLDVRLIRFPVFNLADTFINVGIVCLLIASFRPTARTNGSSGSDQP